MWGLYWLGSRALGRKSSGSLPWALSLRWEGDLALLECQPSPLAGRSF